MTLSEDRVMRCGEKRHFRNNIILLMGHPISRQSLQMVSYYMAHILNMCRLLCNTIQEKTSISLLSTNKNIFIKRLLTFLMAGDNFLLEF